MPAVPWRASAGEAASTVPPPIDAPTTTTRRAGRRARRSSSATAARTSSRSRCPYVQTEPSLVPWARKSKRSTGWPSRPRRSAQPAKRDRPSETPCASTSPTWRASPAVYVAPSAKPSAVSIRICCSPAWRIGAWWNGRAGKTASTVFVITIASAPHGTRIAAPLAPARAPPKPPRNLCDSARESLTVSPSQRPSNVRWSAAASGATVGASTPAAHATPAA